MTDRVDLVAAFVDGEPVGAEELGAALAYEDARAYLVDVLALRGLVTDGRSQSSAVGGLQPAARRRHRSSPWRVAAAAALVVAGVAGGFAAGRGTMGSDTREASLVSSPSAAPVPTHVIRMENGVNWNERSGGN